MSPLVRPAIAAAVFTAFIVAQTADTRSAGAAPGAPPPGCEPLEVTIYGTNGDDVIIGTPGHDVIAGLAGNDEIYGGDGEDRICGGPGDDYIEGNGDEDVLLGEQGDDTLDGGTAGCCDVPTNTGDDVLSGGQGNDTLHSSDFPQAGNTLYGDEGEDTIFVWRDGLADGSENHVYGGNGNDTIYLYSGDATIDGGNGDDVIVNWDDVLTDETVYMIGGRGDDQLVSEDLASTDNMDGGQGEDSCLDGDTTTECEITDPFATLEPLRPDAHP